MMQTFAPMKWDSFLLLSEEEQTAYLEFLFSEFHVGIAVIARDLFHVSRNTLHRIVRRINLEIPSNQGGRIPEIMLAKWKKWLSTGTVSSSQETDTSDRQEKNSSDYAVYIRETVRAMHELYGNIKVTISVEPGNTTTDTVRIQKEV